MKILDFSKLEAFAYTQLNTPQIMEVAHGRVRHILGDEEMQVTSNIQIFPNMFSQHFFQKSRLHVRVDEQQAVFAKH